MTSSKSSCTYYPSTTTCWTSQSSVVNPLNPTASLLVSRTVSAEGLDADWSGIAGVLRIFQSAQGWINFCASIKNITMSVKFGSSLKLLNIPDASPLATILSTNLPRNLSNFPIRKWASTSFFPAQIFWARQKRWFTLLYLLWQNLEDHWDSSLDFPSSWFGME